MVRLALADHASALVHAITRGGLEGMVAAQIRHSDMHVLEPSGHDRITNMRRLPHTATCGLWRSTCALGIGGRVAWQLVVAHDRVPAARVDNGVKHQLRGLFQSSGGGFV